MEQHVIKESQFRLEWAKNAHYCHHKKGEAIGTEKGYASPKEFVSCGGTLSLIWSQRALIVYETRPPWKNSRYWHVKTWNTCRSICDKCKKEQFTYEFYPIGIENSFKKGTTFFRIEARHIDLWINDDWSLREIPF